MRQPASQPPSLTASQPHSLSGEVEPAHQIIRQRVATGLEVPLPAFNTVLNVAARQGQEDTCHALMAQIKVMRKPLSSNKMFPPFCLLRITPQAKWLEREPMQLQMCHLLLYFTFGSVSPLCAQPLPHGCDDEINALPPLGSKSTLQSSSQHCPQETAPLE